LISQPQTTNYKLYAMNYLTDADTRSGTIGGTILVIVLQIDTTQLLSTIILAATGAVVSFAVSVFCKYAWKKLNRKGP
jgi:hypothetical protein